MRYILVSLTTKLFSRYVSLTYRIYALDLKTALGDVQFLKCVTKIAGYNGHKKSKCNVGQC